MIRLRKEQVELAERYAAALETIERLQHLVDAFAAEEAQQYAGSLETIAELAEKWMDDDDAERAATSAANLSEIQRLCEEGYLDEGDAQLAADYAGNLSEIQRLSDECMNEDAVEEAANDARDLREIAGLSS